MSKTRTKRPTKLDRIYHSTRQTYAHESTTTINRVRAPKAARAEALDDSITELTAALLNARNERAVLGAELDGLTAVIALR